MHLVLISQSPELLEKRKTQASEYGTHHISFIHGIVFYEGQRAADSKGIHCCKSIAKRGYLPMYLLPTVLQLAKLPCWIVGVEMI